MSIGWQVEKALDELMSQETGAVVYLWDAAGYGHLLPNTYDVAMSNLGMQIIYREVNGARTGSVSGLSCQIKT